MPTNLYQFEQPRLPKKNSIERKLDWTKVEVLDVSCSLPSFPPKTLKQIVQLIDDNRADEISIFEWLDVIEDHTQWLSLQEVERYDACRAVWFQISLNNGLGDIVFFRLAQQLDDSRHRVVPFLIQTMTVARTAKNLKVQVVTKIDWLIALQEQDWAQLARYCFQCQLTPKAFLSRLHLPMSNQYQFTLLPHLVEVGYQDYMDQNQLETWLLACFDCIKVTKSKVDYFDALLQFSSNDIVPERVRVLLQQYCLPLGDDSYWYHLSDKSRERIRALFNLSQYYSLHTVSQFLYDPDNRESLVLEENEAKRIRSRSMFWSNYADQFLRVRVLLPALTMAVFAKKHKIRPDYISLLSETSDDSPCEVFIFEFEKIIIVEALRGSINEIRIFKNDEWYAKRLFDAPALSLNDIRGLAQMDVHDHVVGWQYFCEKLLRTKYNQSADKHLPYFRGLPPDRNSYSTTKGLPKPDEKLLSERAIQLEQWVEAFWYREFQTDKYGNQSGLKRKSNVYLNKALVEKQCGNEEQYELYIHKAANQGNAEAMWQLGMIKLRSRKGGANARKDGENWIRKAAREGHKEASDAALRYRLL